MLNEPATIQVLTSFSDKRVLIRLSENNDRFYI